jgi:DNA polymerase-1
VLENLLQKANLVDQFQFLMKMATKNVFRAMLRGVRIDATRRAEVAGELLQAIGEREQLIHHIAGYPLNVGSPKQMVEFFYNDLGLPVIKNRKTKQPTCNSEALGKLAEKFPLVKPLTDLIEEKRSLGVFLSTFCMMPLDTDGRMRCSYNVAGTETFRLSSSENAFGSGGNLQNVPKGEEE